MNTVYIVDDDSNVRTALAFYLRSAGFAVRLFGSGQQFVAEMPGLPAGCVLLDLRMPGMDGFEVIAALASRRTRLPVVVMTGHGDVASAVRAMKAGALDFLEKPFDEDALGHTLTRILDTLGGRVRDYDRQAAAAALLASLTEREVGVLHGLITGRSNKLLAHDFGISIRTVEMHRASMMERLGVRTFAEALRIAFDAGAAIDDTTLTHGSA